jgi:hypothetical protein
VRRRKLSKIAVCGAWTLLPLAFHPSASAQCNSPPVALDDAAVYVGGSVLVVDVLANDSADGEALAVSNLSTTCLGTLSEDFGLVTLTVAGFSGDCSIGYRVTDEGGLFDTATVSVLDGTGIFTDSFESGDTSRWSTSQGRAGR